MLALSFRLKYDFQWQIYVFHIFVEMSFRYDPWDQLINVKAWQITVMSHKCYGVSNDERSNNKNLSALLPFLMGLTW